MMWLIEAMRWYTGSGSAAAPRIGNMQSGGMEHSQFSHARLQGYEPHCTYPGAALLSLPEVSCRLLGVIAPGAGRIGRLIWEST